MHCDCTAIQKHSPFTVFTYHAQFCKWGPQWIIHIYPDQCSVCSTVKPNVMERWIKAFNLHLSSCMDQQLKGWYLFCSYWPSLQGLNISSNIFHHIRSNTLFSSGSFKLIFEINCQSLMLTLLSNMNLYWTGYLHWLNKGNGMTVAVLKWLTSIAWLLWQNYYRKTGWYGSLIWVKNELVFFCIYCNHQLYGRKVHGNNVNLFSDNICQLHAGLNS